MSIPPFVIPAALLLTVSAFAQQAEAPTTRAGDLRHFVIPLHTNLPDPVGGEYGVWSAGPDWKASFHDGFRFHARAPELQQAPSFAWRFETLSVGGDEVALPKAEAHWDGRRHETARGALLERYDMREDGVEQSFVLTEHPNREGEIVVRGRIETDLHADRSDLRAGEIDFFRDGESEPRIRYGKATAIDAKGARIDVPTRLEGGRLDLVVPAEFAATASYPLTIDPLTSAHVTSTYAAYIHELSFVGSSPSGATTALAPVVFPFSATDDDLYAVPTTESGAAGSPIGIDITTAWSTTAVDSAELSGVNRWLVAFERHFTVLGTTAVRVQVIGVSATPGTGTTLFAPNDTDHPRVGGTRSGRLGMLACLTTTGISLTLIDGFNVALSSSTSITGSFTDLAMNHMAVATAQWCVLGSEAATGLRAYSVSALLSVAAGGALGTPVGVGSPQVEGDNGRYLATWSETSVQLSSRRIRALRFDISGSTITPNTIRNVASVAILTSLSNGRLAYDYSTQSHWAATWSTYSSLSGTRTASVARLGYQGGVTESVLLDSDAVTPFDKAPAVCFDGDFPSGSRGSFSCVYGDLNVVVQLVHRNFLYDPNAIGQTYGASCSNAVLGDGHPPYAGSQFYNINAQGLPPSAPVFVSVGAGPTFVPLDTIGMTGCVMLVDPLVTLGTTTDASGIAILYLALNDAPLFVGDLYFQWLWLAPGANALGLVNSRGLKVQVR
ncbi:MAG: hypothetical protein U1F36_19470 [Planctomycetota bacterium]